MPYNFRTNPVRKPSYRFRSKAKPQSARTIASKKPTANNQKKQIMTLQRQVTNLKRRTNDVYQYTKFDVPIANLDLLPPVQRAAEDEDAFNVISLMTPNTWQEIFSTNDTVVAQKEAMIMNVRIEAYFTPKNSLISLTQKWVNVWLVSLHKEAAAQCLNQTGNLKTDTATEGLNAQKQGEFYFTRNSNGPFSSMPLLNPKVFKIHQHRKFMIANIMQEEAVADEDVPVVDYNLATKRMVMNQRLGTKLATQTGSVSNIANWKALNEFNIEQTDRLYLITHVGGYANDADNGVNIAPHVTFSVRTVR